MVDSSHHARPRLGLWPLAHVIADGDVRQPATRIDGTGSAIYSVVRQVSTSLTVALLATVLTAAMLQNGAVMGNPQSQPGAVASFHEAFLVAGLIALAAAVLALFVDDRKAASTMRRAIPAAEPELEPAAV